jgi:glycerol-3-phosphate cytidylyltransferase
MLKECKDNCDYLIVGLNVNPFKNGRYCVQSVAERYIQVEAVKYVDGIIPYNTESELIDLLQLINPSVRFIGEDYKEKSFTGDHLDINIFYNTRKHKYSSSGLKRQVIDNQNTLPLVGMTIKDDEVYTIIDNTELNELTVSTTTLHPSQETSGHSHEGIEEVYTFLSGTGSIEIDGEYFPAEKGKTFTIPDGAHHKVYNNSIDEDLLFICVFNNRRNH